MTNPFEELEKRIMNVERLLQKISQQLERQGNEIKQTPGNGLDLAMQVTGLKRKSIYNLVNERKIPHAKKGKRLYFDEKELIDWIKSGKRRTMDELKDEA